MRLEEVLNQLHDHRGADLDGSQDQCQFDFLFTQGALQRKSPREAGNKKAALGGSGCWGGTAPAVKT